MKHVKQLMLSLVFVAGLPVLSPPGAVQAEQRGTGAALFGGQVVSPQGDANAGYPDPYDEHVGTAGVNMEGEFPTGPVTFCYSMHLDVSAIGIPTAAHLHIGLPGTNGPILAELVTPVLGGDGTSRGCVTVDGPAAGSVLFYPFQAYIDVHTPNYPNGAQRGQFQ